MRHVFFEEQSTSVSFPRDVLCAVKSVLNNYKDVSDEHVNSSYSYSSVALCEPPHQYDCALTVLKTYRCVDM